ncbi:MAG: alpha/beta fold hydrolase [Hyphomonadaceae bacterium]|nr:alpha/beta fold hydrolase [Hyphomonadaceae bacterium]
MVGKKNLLLLPGSLCDERLWAGQVRALAEVCAPQALHFSTFESLPAMARDALDHAPPSFALVGFSMGGRVAIEMMRIAPERIERLCLMSASAHPLAGGEAARRQPLIDLAHRDGMEALAGEWLPQLVHPTRRADPGLMAQLTDMACRFTPAEYEGEVHALLTRPDARDVLPSIKCPTLILAGAEDPLSTAARNQELKQAIPHADLVLLKDCGHFPMLEMPEATNAALRAWLG